MPGHAQPMAQEVAQSDMLRSIVIVETKLRQVLPYRRVPVELSLIHQLRHDGGGECLGAAADHINRIGVRREPLLHIPQPPVRKTSPSFTMP